MDPYNDNNSYGTYDTGYWSSDGSEADSMEAQWGSDNEQWENLPLPTNIASIRQHTQWPIQLLLILVWNFFRPKNTNLQRSGPRQYRS